MCNSKLTYRLVHCFQHCWSYLFFPSCNIFFSKNGNSAICSKNITGSNCKNNYYRFSFFFTEKLQRDNTVCFLRLDTHTYTHTHILKGICHKHFGKQLLGFCWVNPYMTVFPTLKRQPMHTYLFHNSSGDLKQIFIFYLNSITKL